MTADAARDRYGTREWFEGQYAKERVDPWGLTWRPSQRLRYQRVLDALQQIEEPVPEVMDVGCATGEFTHLIAQRIASVRSVLGVDFSESAIARARSRAPNVTFTAESLASLGATYRGRFDLVACLEVLYYVRASERAIAMRSLREVVRDGGFLVVSSFVGSAPYFTPDELLRLVATEFEVVRWECLHLRAVSFVERLGSRLDTRLRGPGGIAGDDGLGRRLATLPWPMVVRIERWSKCLGSRLASHVLVLARARARVA